MQSSAIPAKADVKPSAAGELSGSKAEKEFLEDKFIKVRKETEEQLVKSKLNHSEVKKKKDKHKASAAKMTADTMKQLEDLQKYLREQQKETMTKLQAIHHDLVTANLRGTQIYSFPASKPTETQAKPVGTQGLLYPECFPPGYQPLHLDLVAAPLPQHTPKQPEPQTSTKPPS